MCSRPFTYIVIGIIAQVNLTGGTRKSSRSTSHETNSAHSSALICSSLGRTGAFCQVVGIYSIRMGKPTPDSPPLLVYLERVHPWNAFDRGAIVTVCLCLARHGQAQTNRRRCTPITPHARLSDIELRLEEC